MSFSYDPCNNVQERYYLDTSDDIDADSNHYYSLMLRSTGRTDAILFRMTTVLEIRKIKKQPRKMKKVKIVREN